MIDKRIKSTIISLSWKFSTFKEFIDNYSQSIMKKYCRVCLISLFCCLWFFLGCNRSSDEETTNNASETQRVTEVKTAEAKTGRIVNTISTTGTVVARRETRIRPKVSGRIESILVDEGDNVDAEQVLVRLEQEDFLLAKHYGRKSLLAEF